MATIARRASGIVETIIKGSRYLVEVMDTGNHPRNQIEIVG